MKISGISNSTNFGLLQTNYYKSCKNQLISLAQTTEDRKKAVKIAERIKDKAPNAFLTTDDEATMFVLGQKYDEKLKFFFVGDIDANKPVKTFSELEQNLTKFEQNPDDIELIHPDEVNENVNDWWLYPFTVIQTKKKVPEILKKFFPVDLIEQIAKKVLDK